MASIFTAIGDFVHGIYQLFLSLFQTVYHVFETIITMILNFFTGILTLIGDTFQGVFGVVGGVGNFVITNALILGLIAAAGYGYLVYQRRQGNVVQVQGKKLN